LALLNGFHDVVVLFEEPIRELQADHSPTLNLVIPHLVKLEKGLKDFSASQEQPVRANIAKLALFAFKKKLEMLSKIGLYSIALFLDPVLNKMLDHLDGTDWNAQKVNFCALKTLNRLFADLKMY
jgi:hypothetical protein